MNPDSPDDGVDVDAAWAEIIANWDAPTIDPRRSSADSGDLEPGPPGATPDPDPEQEDEPGAGRSPGRHARERGVQDRSTDRAPGQERSTAERPEPGRVAGSLSWDELRITDDDPPQSRLPQPSEPPLTPPPPAAGAGAGPRDVAPDGPSLIDGLDGEDESDSYQMPDPPKLPRPTLVSALSWIGAIGAPLLLLLAAVFWRTAPALLIGGAVVAFIAGFISLVFRMPERDEDDDGAVL